MRVILHAGMHKTGTTSFQALLMRNGPRLLQQGIRALGPSDVTLAKDPRFDARRASSDLVAECRRDGVDTLVVSREGISTHDAQQLRRLMESFGNVEMRLVVVLRHWAQWLPSRWMQNCRRRDSQTFSKFLERVEETPPNQFGARFDQIINRAEDAGFRDIAVVSYDNAVQSEGVIATLLRVCGLDRAIVDDDGDSPGNRRNLSSPLDLVEQVRLFNGVYSTACCLEPDALFDAIRTFSGVDRCFDYIHVLPAILLAAPQVSQALKRLLSERSITVTLSPDRFVDLSDSLDKKVRPYLVNPIDNHVFPSPEANSFAVSDLRVEDLPADLCRDMLGLLKAPTTAA